MESEGKSDYYNPVLHMINYIHYKAMYLQTNLLILKELTLGEILATKQNNEYSYTTAH